MTTEGTLAEKTILVVIEDILVEKASLMVEEEILAVKEMEGYKIGEFRGPATTVEKQVP